MLAAGMGIVVKFQIHAAMAIFVNQMVMAHIDV